MREGELGMRLQRACVPAQLLPAAWEAGSATRTRNPWPPVQHPDDFYVICGGHPFPPAANRPAGSGAAGHAPPLCIIQPASSATSHLPAATACGLPQPWLSKAGACLEPSRGSAYRRTYRLLPSPCTI